MVEKCKNHQYVVTQKGKFVCTVCGHEKSPSRRPIGVGIAAGFANVAILIVILYVISYAAHGDIYNMSNDGMAPSIEPMDILLAEKTPFADIKKGDVIIFLVHSQDKHSISRVTEIKENPRILQTRADNNSTNVHFVTQDTYVSKIYSVIPKLGYVLNPSSLLILGIIIFMIPAIVIPSKAKRKYFKQIKRVPEYETRSNYESYEKPTSSKIKILAVVIALALFAEVFVQVGGVALIQQGKPFDLNYNSQQYTVQPSNDLYAYALQVINKDRSDHGLSPVQFSNNTSAQNHANDMLQNEYFSHWNTMGVKPYVTYTQTGGKGAVAENIAYSFQYCEGSILCNLTPYDPQQQITDLEYGMMYNDSASNWGHRDNILNPYHTHVSIGVAYDVNRFYFVEHFENNIIDWQKLDLVNGNLLEMVGTFPEGYSLDSIDVYSDPNPQSLSGTELDEESPYDSGHYDAGTLVGKMVEQSASDGGYQECSSGKILLTFATGGQKCVDYVTYHNKSRYSNGIDISVDVSKWVGHDGLHTIYTELKDKNGTDVEGMSLTLEYLK